MGEPNQIMLKQWYVYAHNAEKGVKVLAANRADAEVQGGKIFSCKPEQIIARYVKDMLVTKED